MKNRLTISVVGWILVIHFFGSCSKSENKQSNFIEQQIHFYDSLAMINTRINLDSTAWYAQKINTFCDSVNYPNGKAWSFKNLGLVDNIQRDYKSAIENFTKSYEIAKHIEGKYKLKLMVLARLANTYDFAGEKDKAFQTYLKALSVLKEKNLPKPAMDVHNSLGLFYYNLHSYDNALKHYLISLEWADSIPDGRLKDINVSMIYGNLGRLFMQRKNYQEALTYHKKSLNLTELSKDTVGIVITILNFGAIEAEQNNYQLALSHAKRALELIDQTGKGAHLKNIAQLNIDAANIELGNTNEALVSLNKYDLTTIQDSELKASILVNFGKTYQMRNDFKNAKKYAQEAFKTASKGKHQYISKNALLLLSEINHELGNYSLAYKNIGEVLDLTDTLNEQEMVQRIDQLNVVYQTKLKVDSIQLLKSKTELAQVAIQQKATESKRKGWMIAALLSLIGGLGFIIYSIRKKNRQISEAKERTEILLNAYESIKEKSIKLGIRDIPLDEILYARVRNKITTLFFEKVNEQGHIEHSYYSYEITLQQLLAQLKLKSFLDFARINQNYIVNFQKVAISKEGKESVIERLTIDKEKFSDVHDANISTLPRSEIGRFFQKERERFLKIQQSKD